MLRKLLDYSLRITAEEKPLRFLRPLTSAIDAFLYEVPLKTAKGPHIRDAIDLKRWMIIVVFALLPATCMAVWNTGLQKTIYMSGNAKEMHAFLSLVGFSEYFSFCFSNGLWKTIIYNGLSTFLPILIISYAVGGFWEALFAYFRRHEISEGFLVTGILFALILPPTIPYWMVAVGVSVGVVLAKELFGGTGMNILNPALVCRCFLFFAYPAYMSGSVWVGSNQYLVKESLVEMNSQRTHAGWDAYSQATFLGKVNSSTDVARIHVATIGETYGAESPLSPLIRDKLATYNKLHGTGLVQGKMSPEELSEFLTEEKAYGGLGLSSDSFGSAMEFAQVRYGRGQFSDGNLFFGNMLGSIGETSTFAIILGAILLIITQIGSWRTMLSVAAGAFITALFFQYGSHLGFEMGAWNPAKFDLPAYKHLCVGGLAFGLVFMATDPVSSPSISFSHYIYGGLIGALTIVIRDINPAFPEGVMLSILFANVFGPLMDKYALQRLRKRRARCVHAKKAI